MFLRRGIVLINELLVICRQALLKLRRSLVAEASLDEASPPLLLLFIHFLIRRAQPLVVVVVVVHCSFLCYMFTKIYSKPALCFQAERMKCCERSHRSKYNENIVRAVIPQVLANRIRVKLSQTATSRCVSFNLANTIYNLQQT